MSLLGGILSGIGAIGGALLGGPAGAALGAGIGGSIGNAIDNDTDDAYKAQADATLASAAAARDVANAQLAGMQAQANAYIKASENAALGGIVGAALGAHTTTEEIIRRLPVESGAATIASWELAQRWNKTITMQQQGYQNVAIEHELAGGSGAPLYKDATWNTLYMSQKVKDASIAAANIFGIQSKANPAGIALTWDDWLELNSLKRPEEMLKVDPAVSAARQKQFAAWESQMRASGQGLVVDLYKNPQLAGQSLEAMGGKEPLLDPRLAPLISQVAGGSNIDIGALTQSGDYRPPAFFNSWGEYSSQNSVQIDNLKKLGVIDANNMINAGALLQLIPANLREPPPFEPLRKLSQKELIGLQDQYNALMNKVVDPKLVRIDAMGFGVSKQSLYNPDGSLAMSYMTGQMQMADGSTQNVILQGTRLQEWYDMQSIIDGMGPTFPGMFAPRSYQEYEGIREKKNVFAKPAGGFPGQPGEKAASVKMQQQDFSQNPYAQSMQLGGAARTPGAVTEGSSGKATVTQTQVPAGYEGAPLAAGE